MKYVYIGKETVESMEDLHSVFSNALNFPDYYGKNLDALNDCLSELNEDCIVLLADKAHLSDLIGPKFEAFLSLLENVVIENDSIFVREFA